MSFQDGDVARMYGVSQEKILDDITNGRETFMRAFSTGDMTARGDFPLIRTLDEYFPFA